jgi:cell division septation protein DedD
LAAQEESIIDSDGSGVKAPDVEYPEILRGKIDDPDEARATPAEKPKAASATSPKVKRRRVPEKPKVIKYPVPEVPSAPAKPRTAAEPAADEPKKTATTAGAQAKPTQATQSAPPSARPDPPPGAPKSYTLQAISVQDQVAAQKMVAKLRNKGFAAFLTEGEIPGKGTWYRVRVGGYKNRAEAEPIIRRLQAEGIEPMLIRQ